jgi:long-subunit fatty acid transport protein
VLSLGAALRIGIGLFDVDDVESAFRAKPTMNGASVGGTLGAMIRPHWRVQIGFVYRTPLNIEMKGSGAVTKFPSMETSNQSGTLSVEWPQSVALAVAVRPHARLLATLQGDWTGWSSVQNLNVELAGAPNIKQMRYHDSYALHLGLQGVITRFLLARLGWTLDGNAIPDGAVRRENQDGLKSTLAVGLGVHVWKLFLDGAFEAFLPMPARTVGTQTGIENEAGTYDARVYTVELSAQIRF